MQRNVALENIVRPIVEGLGYNFVGLEYIPAVKSPVLRIYIDRSGGVSIDDCQRISHKANQTLSVESDMANDYTLEVSSPGIDRKLFTLGQCQEQIGQLIKVNLIRSINGRSNFKGKLMSVIDRQLQFNIDGGEISIAFEDIKKARVVPQW